MEYKPPEKESKLQALLTVQLGLTLKILTGKKKAGLIW